MKRVARRVSVAREAVRNEAEKLTRLVGRLVEYRVLAEAAAQHHHEDGGAAAGEHRQDAAGKAWFLLLFPSACWFRTDNFLFFRVFSSVFY